MEGKAEEEEEEERSGPPRSQKKRMSTEGLTHHLTHCNSPPGSSHLTEKWKEKHRGWPGDPLVSDNPNLHTVFLGERLAPGLSFRRQRQGSQAPGQPGQNRLCLQKRKGHKGVKEPGLVDMPVIPGFGGRGRKTRSSGQPGLPETLSQKKRNK